MREDQDDDVFDGSMTNEFERSTGPKKFSYSELARCTNIFSQEQMIGQGGFWSIYKGYLREYNSYIASKRVSRKSKKGIKKYASELGYPFFNEKSHLTGTIRFKIAQGLASALLYLHEEWEQCVGSQTTDLAGTMGYMAPECVNPCKGSKETNIYSFGIIVLEIACGMKPIDPNNEEHEVNIVDWVWRLYGMRNLHEAVDPKLSSEFNEQEMEHLVIVDLWCAHPNNNCRLFIRKKIHVLNFEAPLPILPSYMPVQTYYSSSHHIPTISLSSNI
ncbi:hypothetical protein HAX54_011300 [Datura stramonium]|uniref:Protein kinase domain-containing protein n=1 Tax=Datura stramonium TaxID=4076 RepID=A0ABS8RX83_DATST|nr:hypothetical protein [Datura stramonium]